VFSMEETITSFLLKNLEEDDSQSEAFKEFLVELKDNNLSIKPYTL
jgi:hypothetical protein